MTIYLQAPGAKGNVSAEGYQDWVSLLKFSLSGIRRSVEQRTGSMYNRMSGPTCGMVWIQKLADSSSVFWFNASTRQQVISKVDIHFVTAGNPLETYMTYTLTNAAVSFFNHEQDEAEGNIIENLMLAYDTLENSYFPRSANNTQQSPVRTGYNVAQGVSM
ncbi:MAG: type VI secretion system tube protein Hcp [Proteobacteria bacterium]|nr:type VI secretion system tube protein Hcp [Pseudomonadota bacterium]